MLPRVRGRAETSASAAVFPGFSTVGAAAILRPVHHPAVHGASHPSWHGHAALWALAALAVAGLAAGALWLWRRRRLVRQLRREPRPRHPVVLAHGLFGFDEIALGSARHAYFRGVPDRLAQSGHVVHAARVAKAAGVEVRARELARFVEQLPDAKVNIVAHSMGGLDARYAIARLGLGKRVASLTTIGTPHRGTPLADLGTSVGARLGLRALLQKAGLELDAFDDLTVARLSRFNAEVPDDPRVAYASVVGVARQKRRVNPLLLPSYLYLREREGENDGLVPARSQQWGEVVAQIDADHWAQIGWSRHFDAAEFYAQLLRELRGRGL